MEFNVGEVIGSLLFWVGGWYAIDGIANYLLEKWGDTPRNRTLFFAFVALAGLGILFYSLQLSRKMKSN